MPPKESDALLGDEENNNSSNNKQRRKIFGKRSYSGSSPSLSSDSSTDDEDFTTPKTTNVSVNDMIKKSVVLKQRMMWNISPNSFCFVFILLAILLIGFNYETVLYSFQRYHVTTDVHDNSDNDINNYERSDSSSSIVNASISTDTNQDDDETKKQQNTKTKKSSSKLRSEIHKIAASIANATAPKNDDEEEGKTSGSGKGNGPYKLIEMHKGKSFFDYYTFNNGPDSQGSAGYNTYVSEKKAKELNLIRVVNDENNENDEDVSVYISSSRGDESERNNETGTNFLLRDSVRLEGKTRFDHGLIVFDVTSMPTGCGIWPAFWTTDEHDWPKNGEIDIVEPINNQDVVKTALHTSEGCDMYAHVPRWNWTGYWDTATGLPDTYTGELNYNNKLEADNCWTLTPHQWANQGCVAVNSYNGTIGQPINDGGGAVYVLEWDPNNGYIKSWVFPKFNTEKNGGVPSNLKQSILSATTTKTTKTKNSAATAAVLPDPSNWPIPYAYFAIGENSGCSSDHFQNHHIVINLAFCGMVAGNRFARDCPELYDKYNAQLGYKNDSIAACNAYIDSDEAQQILNDTAYWDINGVYFYQRE